LGDQVRINFPGYDNLDCAADVDLMTANRINKLHGPNPGDELKDLRSALLAIIAILRPGLFPPTTLSKLMEHGDRLLSMNAKIEEIIAEGRAYKKAMGWQ
jgi:hypothetical protein